MFQLVHLSDLHLRSGDKTCLFHPEMSHANRKLPWLVEAIDREFPDAHVVITGDITDSGTSPSVRQALSLLAPWLQPQQLSIVPGNHDCGTKGSAWLRERKQHLIDAFANCTPTTYPWVKTVGPLALIGLDSTAGTRGHVGEVHAREVQNQLQSLSPEERIARAIHALKTRYGEAGASLKELVAREGVRAAVKMLERMQFANGEVGEEQRARLVNLLARDEVRCRIPVVLLHHHPWVPGPLKHAFTALNDAEPLLELLEDGRAHAPVAAVLFGHDHREGEWTQGGVRFFAAPASVADVDGVLAFRVLDFDERGLVGVRWHRVTGLVDEPVQGR